MTVIVMTKAGMSHCQLYECLQTIIGRLAGQHRQVLNDDEDTAISQATQPSRE